METLDTKNTVTEIKIAYEQTQQNQETISEDKCKPIKISKTEADREKIIMIKIILFLMKRTSQSCRTILNYLTYMKLENHRNKMETIGIQEIFEETMAEKHSERN